MNKFINCTDEAVKACELATDDIVDANMPEDIDGSIRRNLLMQRAIFFMLGTISVELRRIGDMPEVLLAMVKQKISDLGPNMLNSMFAGMKAGVEACPESEADPPLTAEDIERMVKESNGKL